ncbi:sulfotransferase family protein [Sphingomicrobium astaxanthinifaciens]|uniref:sulfotransferase family protein n=1 Tax=Sphingomicrobium astaxanthinifaciens TaxID=1227949 RepID=UPI001FCAC1EB|nr:sulfotransferase [Sphingomicrobium astaxanthinifaciens]MCJ7420578.1 sulfotransferase [Sphingomicrobium astaxanthinifaciens]
MATLAPDVAVADRPARAGDSLAAARWLDRLLCTLWRQGVTPRPSLAPGALIDHATRAEGRAPAPGDWEERLAILTRSLAGEARLSPLGRAIAFGQIVRKLRCRIRAEAQWARDPAILSRPVTRPLVIVGQMRSGTTRLHRLLAQDPGFAHTRAYETMIPVPTGGPLETRPLTATANLLFLRALNPLLAAVHPTGPFQAEEEFGFHAMSIFGAQFEGQWQVGAFARHCENCDRAPVYAEFRRTLQTIATVRDEPPGKPWVLKAPQFTQDLDALHAAFPDARFLFLHRDLAQVVGSSASLAYQQARVQSRHVDPHAIGAEWLRKTRLRYERVHDFRVRHPGLEALDICFDEVGRDWRGQMHRLYDFLGRPLEPKVEAAMAAFLGKSKAHRKHRYDLEDFGLSQAAVRAAIG